MSGVRDLEKRENRNLRYCPRCKQTVDLQDFEDNGHFRFDRGVREFCVSRRKHQKELPR